eukprot:GDKH01025911.1.p1 GENE.GDKH01025911.1~~GDKH01025911.1.p1  ORF type:complete len:249 (-),score=19.55 GDKH01025911.1:487-1233(-)
MMTNWIAFLLVAATSAVSHNVTVDDEGVMRTTDFLNSPVQTAPLYHHVPLSGFLTLDFAAVSGVESVHLRFADGVELISNVQAVLRTGFMDAQVFLGGGMKLKVHERGLELLDSQGVRISGFTVTSIDEEADDLDGATTNNSSGTDSLRRRQRRRRRLVYDNCAAGGCGSLRIAALKQPRDQQCHQVTGVGSGGLFGNAPGWNPCMSPGGRAMNYADPYSNAWMGIRNPLSCNFFNNMGCSFARQNGW